MKEEARAHRLAIDWLEVNIDSLEPIAEAASLVRESWNEWNPQRAAAKKLEEDVRAGRVTLEDTIRARKDYFRSIESQSLTHPKPSAERCAGTGLVDPTLAPTLGRHPHGKPFLWPSPKSPGTYTALDPVPPPGLFISLPWVEGEGAPSATLNPNQQRGGYEPGLPYFNSTVNNATGIFEKNPEYFKTVHIGGAGREKEEEATKRAEREAWENKVVVEDKVMRLTLPRTDRVCQVDRLNIMLQGQPKKKSFKDTHVPPPPLSIFKASEQHNKQRTVEAGKDRGKFDPTKSTGEDDFDRFRPPVKSLVASPRRDMADL